MAENIRALQVACTQGSGPLSQENQVMANIELPAYWDFNSFFTFSILGEMTTWQYPLSGFFS